jgi:hypothetical protein
VWQQVFHANGARAGSDRIVCQTIGYQVLVGLVRIESKVPCVEEVLFARTLLPLPQRCTTTDKPYPYLTTHRNEVPSPSCRRSDKYRDGGPSLWPMDIGRKERRRPYR